MKINSKFFKNINFKKLELVSIFAYKSILDFIVLVFMKNYNYYYVVDFNVLKWIISTIVIFLLYRLIQNVDQKINKFILKLFYFLMFIPISTIYMARNFSTICYILFFIEFIIIIYTIKGIDKLKKKRIFIEIKEKIRSKVKINYKAMTKMIYYGCIINTILLLVLCIYYNGIPSLSALNLSNVYEIREQFYLPKYIYYLFTFETSFILQFLLVVFLHKKKYLKMLIIILVQLIFYLLNGEKMLLFSIFLVIGVYKLYEYIEEKIEKVVPYFLIIMCLVSILFFNNVDMILAIFVTRLLVIPANLKFIYFDYFSANPKIGIVGTILNFFIKTPNPYGDGLPYQNLIAGQYFNKIEMYSDTGMLIEGFTRFGYIGFILIPIIMGIVLYIINHGSKKNGLLFTIGISIFPMLMLNEGFLLPSLTFGGILLLLFVCIFFDINLLFPKKENNGVVILTDEPFEPDIRAYKEAKQMIKNGYNVEIVCFDKKNRFKDKPTEIYDGIPIKRIFCRTEKTTKLIENNRIVSKFKNIIYAYWMLKFIVKVKIYLKNKDFSILHCQNLLMSFIGVIFFRDKKIVFDMREFYEDRNNKIKDLILKTMTKYTQNECDWIIYVNEFQKSKTHKKNHHKMLEIPNYPQKEQFKNINKIKSDKLRISYIGKVRDYQSMTTLIDLDDDLIDVSIYGNGSELDRLIKYANSKGRKNIMKGAYNSIQDTEKMYRNTDILYAVYNTNSINANNWKNAMPIKSFEAIISLTPIIASKNTVLGDFVTKNNIGFTIIDNDKTELKKLIKKIKKDKSILDEKILNLKKIQTKYIWEEASKKLDIIYVGGRNEQNL